MHKGGNMEKETTVYTKNGVAIYGYKNPSLHSFYISLFIKAGSMYEEERESGITHFLEHSIIRNVNSQMQGQLYRQLDIHGVEFNASTYSEMVQLYAYGASESFSFAADIFSLALSPIVLSGDDIAAERDRIKAEIREADDRTSLATFTQGIVHEGTSLSRPILGTLGSVSRITASKLEKYRRRVIGKDNIFFYVTGSYTDEDIAYLSELVGKAELYCGEARNNVAPVADRFFRRDGAVHLKNADFTMLRFNFDMDMSRLSLPATDLLYDLLLSGYNSRLFIEMSERRGLFYDLNGAVERYKNIGSFTFSYELRPDAVYTATEITLSILGELCTRLLTEEECMKAGYVKNAYMLYDDPRELNFTFAYDNHILDNGYLSLSDRADRYRAVTPELLRSTAREIFTRDNLTLTVKGNKRKIDTERLASIIRDGLKFD